MNNKLKILGTLGMVLVLASCGTSGSSEATSSGSGTKPQNIIPMDDPYLPGLEIKDDYNTLAATAITDGLNYLTLSSGDSASYFANFVDPLVMHNEFGALEKCLAVSFKQENNYQKFTVKIREGVQWMNNDGTPYEPIVEGKKTPQYVNANDFVAAAKIVLTKVNASKTYYMYTKFVEGAAAYYHLSYVQYENALGTPYYVKLWNNKKKLVDYLNKKVSDETGKPSRLTINDLAKIETFENVGVKVIEQPGANGGGTIEYSLIDSMFYFPTILNYSCYLPVNERFFNSVGALDFGRAADKILYCGPFLLSTWNDTKIVFTKNENYWNAEDVHVKHINYAIVSGAILTYDYARKEFEKGTLDGVNLNQQDVEGWQKYVAGPDNTGTIENPYSSYVNSRDINVIDYVYGHHLNVNRMATQKSAKSYATEAGGSATAIKNKDRAFALDAVRELVLRALDFESYCEQFTLPKGYEAQYLLHTYVPKGFVSNEAGQDYVEGHYAPVYAAKKGMTVEEAKKEIAPMQYKDFAKTSDELAVLRQNALDAINLWNSTADATNKITLPVQMEYFSVWTNADQKKLDAPIINAYNKNLNGGDSNDYFKVIPTTDVTITQAESVSNSGNFDISTQWGWGPDYGDPMSYLNTFVKHGDWSSIFGYVDSDDPVDSYRVVNGKLEKYDLLEDYTAKVRAANAVYDNLNERYNKFAEAEYILLNELSIYQPLHMRGQGWNVSISRAAGYHSPQGSYGLSSHRLQGLYVAKDIKGIPGDLRKKARDAHEAAKKAYFDAGNKSINVYDK